MSPDSGSPITVAANGWEFSGYTWGPETGRTVLLLHGFPQTARSWTSVAARLADAGLRAVALNQRGYSPGARPSDVSAYAMPHLVADVVGMIDALGGPVDLVGHDWGGVVGWQVAARRPDRVRTWTAVSTPNQLAINEALASSAEERARFGYILAFREVGRAEEALLADDAAGLRFIYGGIVGPDRAAEDVALFREPGVLTLALNWYRAMSRHDADGLPDVTVPTAYVWGSADVAFSRAAAERSGAFVDAPYTFTPLEKASHWLPDERPDVIAREVLRLTS